MPGGLTRHTASDGNYAAQISATSTFLWKSIVGRIFERDVGAFATFLEVNDTVEHLLENSTMTSWTILSRKWHFLRK